MNSQQIHSQLSRNKWYVKDTTSSLCYPKSNGKIERTIQMIKKSTKKALKGNNDRTLALLTLCTSTGPENNTPLVTLFYNHAIRTLLSSMNKEVSQENKKLI